MHDAAAQSAAVTSARLVKPPYFNGVSDRLSRYAMIRGQKIWDVILGAIVQQSARAEERAIIVK